MDAHFRAHHLSRWFTDPTDVITFCKTVNIHNYERHSSREVESRLPLFTLVLAMCPHLENEDNNACNIHLVESFAGSPGAHSAN